MQTSKLPLSAMVLLVSSLYLQYSQVCLLDAWSGGGKAFSIADTDDAPLLQM